MSTDPQAIGQAEIDELLKQARVAAQAPSVSPAGATVASSGALPTGGLSGIAGAQATAVASAARMGKEGSSSGFPSSPGDDIQFLLDQAEAAIASVTNPKSDSPNLPPYEFRDLSGSPASQEKATLEALSDVELDLKIELGRTWMNLEEVLKLRRGSVVALDKLAGDPVDVYVNGRLIARGEVLVLNENFCVRVAELVTGEEST